MITIPRSNEKKNKIKKLKGFFLKENIETE